MTSEDEMNPELIINHNFPTTTYTYSEGDVALYALGIGACAKDALDEKELKYLYDEDGKQAIQMQNKASVVALHDKGSLVITHSDPNIAEVAGVLYQTTVKECNRVLAGFVDLNHIRSSFL